LGKLQFAAKVAILIPLTVSIVLSVNYLMIKLYLQPVYEMDYVLSLLILCAVEGMAFIVIGIQFLQEYVEHRRGHYAMMDSIHEGPWISGFTVFHKGRPMLRATLMGAGIILFILGMIIIPMYYNL
jgi:hypothetical protein